MRPRRFYWDRLDGEHAVPSRGDLIYGPVALYEALDARPVESTRHPDRYALQLRRIGTRPADVADAIATHTGCQVLGRAVRNTPQMLEHSSTEKAWA